MTPERTGRMKGWRARAVNTRCYHPIDGEDQQDERDQAGVPVAGARESTARRFEDNVVFDRDDRTLMRTGRVLRVRRDGDRIVLTLKTPVEGTHAHKLRNEYETEVADQAALTRILTELGFAPAYR